MKNSTLRALNTITLALMLVCGQAALAQGKSAEPAKKPAASTTQEEKLAPVLPPEQFFGAAAMGYAAAKAVPEICHKLFCYCGCDITDSHNNLLDCFTSTHGADCHICQEEALQALRMDRADKSLAEIQKNIDDTYASKYPFKEESPALKRYRATRLYMGGGAKPATPAGNPDDACCAGKKKALDNRGSTPVKAPGAGDHSCCADKKRG